MKLRPAKQTVSVIVPTLNGETTLVEFFAALKVQQLQPDEILVGDCQSDDRTAEICRDNGAEIIVIPRSSFDHGGTRTMLAKRARGSLLVFFTQDAVLAGPGALNTIVESLESESTAACVYGRQLPRNDASLLSAHLREFNYPAVSQTRSFADRQKYGLKTIFISNSFAAYKKAVLAENGYFKDNLIFGEDTFTLGKLLMAGYKVVYCAEAKVYHSHNYTLLEEFQRAFDIGVLHSREKWLLDTYGLAEGVGSVYVKSAFAAIAANKKYHLVVDWFFRMGCKYGGYKLGKLHRFIPRSLRPLLSLHRLWWKDSPR